MCRHLFLVIFLFIINSSSGQSNYPTGCFISPLDITLSVSGTFGELRSTHLHSGIDFRTRGVEGLPIVAVADGYVSRILVSPTGFGKAIYIHHPNGYTSVYGHCRNFTPEIDDFIRQEQYRKESFAVNLFPTADQFSVKQGQFIAHSGNTGSSMGPHLHFEIRKTNGQIPVNPLHFGFQVRDFIRPTIEKFVVYPHGNGSSVNGMKTPTAFELAGWGAEYRLKSNDTIAVSGAIYFGIETYDRLNDSNNKNGVYSVELFQDSALVYAHRMDEFPFDETRYVLSLKDYRRFVSDKRRIQRTRIEPNNRLSVYRKAENNGIFRFDEERIYLMQYVVKDAHGNESKLTFHLKGSPPDFRNAMEAAMQANNPRVMDWKKDNRLEADGLILEIPANALYDTIHFTFSTEPPFAGSFSPVYNLHHKYTPLQGFCSLSVKPESIPPDLKDKALIVSLNGSSHNAVGGTWNNDYLTARIRDFGSFTVFTDTLAPEITPLNIFMGKDISAQNTIRIKIKDDLAGIESYRTTMNGKWILMEHDPKNELLIYHIDERTTTGKNDFRLTVTDTRGNIAVYEAILIR
jgi:hypothetical protein